MDEGGRTDGRRTGDNFGPSLDYDFVRPCIGIVVGVILGAFLARDQPIGSRRRRGIILDSATIISPGSTFLQSSLRQWVEQCGTAGDPATKMIRALQSPDGTDPFPPSGNLLLKSLPPAEIARLTAHLRAYSSLVGEELHCRGDSDPDVFFPVESVSSLVVAGPEGSGIEVATVGREGMVGLPVFIQSEKVDFKAFTQIPGRGYRMPRAVLRRELAAKGTFADHLKEYTEAVLLAVGQASFCCSAHGQVERCARWLLSARDRTRQSELTVTQDFLAELLGVRRATVSIAVEELRRRKLVSTSRGRIRILDAKRLQSVACDCYRSVRREFDALLKSWEVSANP